MRVIVVHGWDGYPEEGWFPWLKRELEKRKFEVKTPQLPDPDKPMMQKWIPALTKVVGVLDEETFFVGHSMGCQAIARYLESLKSNVKVGGAVFVAGFFKRLTNLEDESDVQEIAKHWLTAPLNFQKIKKHLNRSVAIFSDDDPYVPLDNQDDFRNKLGSEIIIEHKQGHFSGSTGTLKVPSVLESLLKMSSKR